MLRDLNPRFWRVAALGLAALVLFNGLLLSFAWIGFALARPEYFEEGWPTFSRALTIGDLRLYRWLAGLAGAGLLFGAAAVAVMNWQRARAHPQARGALTLMALGAALASALGLVHYFHVAVTLSMNNNMHMLLSYTFFFGMSAMILVDHFCSLQVARRLPPAALDRLVGARFACGWSVLAVGAVFLLTYVLKDVESNPWAGATQRAFVAAEAGWIVLAHAYAALYLPAAREHFGAQLRARGRTGVAARAEA